MTGKRLSLIVLTCIWLAPTPAASTATFSELSSRPFGEFNGVEYAIHTGRFSGSTPLGTFSVPFEIVAPADPGEGNGAVLFEPPHFSLRTAARDALLGRGFLFDRGSHFLFERGFSHAAVGFGDFGLNILDPSLPGLMLAGGPVESPGGRDPDGQTLDEEIIVQFVRLLQADPGAAGVAGEFSRVYSFGVSQTSAVLLNLLLGPDGQGLFDYSMLALRFWPEPEQLDPEIFPRLSGTFSPPDGIGKLMFVQSESELVRTDAEQLRTSDPDVRTYEIAGAAHNPAPPIQIDPGPPPVSLNSLDGSAMLRALFAAGDAWVQSGRQPPPDAWLATAADGTIDPVYGFATGIARDANLNALGGIRVPDLAVGRAQYIATVPFLDPPRERFPGMLGLRIDLACVPLPNGTPRFRNHGDYVSRFARQTNRLVAERMLLETDAEVLKTRAAESDIGMPRSCR